MSTTTFQTPSLFSLNAGTPPGYASAVSVAAVTNVSEPMLPSASPSSTPPNNKRSSDCGSSSGISAGGGTGMNSKNNEGASSSESAASSSSLVSDSGLINGGMADFASPAPLPSQLGPNNGHPLPPVTTTMFPLPHHPAAGMRFVRPPPPPHHFYTTTAIPMVATTGAALPNHSSANLPVAPNGSNPSSGSTAALNGPASTSGALQSNGLQAPSPSAVIPGIPPNGTALAAATPGQSNDLFVHVEQGETISLAVGNEIQHIAGPATIRMVGISGTAPSPLPLHVPMGHNISQIVDEKGVLRHLILSPQNALTVPTNAGNLPPSLGLSLQNLTPHKPSTTSAQHPPFSSSNINNSIPTTASATQALASANSPPKSTSPPEGMVRSYPPPSSNLGASSANNNSSNNNLQHEQSASPQPFGAQQSRKRVPPTKRNSGQQVNPSESPAYNGTAQENNSSSITVAAQNHQTTIDQEERERLLEALNRIHQPTITRVGVTDADVHWQELDTSEAAASGGPFPQIDASEFVYEIFLYETSPTGKLLTQKECPPLSSYNGVRLTRLKPRTNYHVAVRASLPERQLLGQQSPTAAFRTYGMVPETPQYFRFTQRGPNFLTFAWVCPSNVTNGGSSTMITYLLQIAKGKPSSPYETVYEGPADQARINRLDPATSYKARVAAQNESGRSEFTPPLIVSTTPSNNYQQHPPSMLPTTSASTSTQMGFYPMYPPHHMQAAAGMGAGVHPHASLAHYAPMSTPSPMFSPPKLSAPTLGSVTARGVRLSWQSTDLLDVKLEMAEVNRNGPPTFVPVPVESYVAPRMANISNLKSNRDYRFRLVGTTANGEPVFSEQTHVKTHKDRYENTAYYQNYQGSTADKERLPAPVLQKLRDDESSVELSWKYPAYDYDTITYVLEGSSYTNSPDQTNNDQQWKLCYRGADTTYTVYDAYLSLFRVQAVNKRNASSAWSEPCFVRRPAYRNKRQVPAQTPYPRNQQQQQQPQQYHNQSYSSTNPNQQRQNTPPAQKTSAETQRASSVDLSAASEPPASPPAPIKAPGCSLPKLSNITQSTIEISWKPTSTLDLEAEEVTNKCSLIYELQRVDKQAFIVYSGTETQFQLENLRPVEHVQLRVRAVIVDYEGKRTEGDWSPIGSGITVAGITTPPQNLRVKSESAPFVLAWDAPAQLNGSDVIEYLVSSAHFAMEENKQIDSLALQQLASTERLEYSIETLLPAHIYVFSVATRNEAGRSAPSERLEFTSPPTAPSPPLNLHLEANSFENLRASWSASASNGAIIEAYRLTLYYEKSVIVQETVSFETHEYNFTNLEAEKQYTLEAQAKNNVGWSKAARTTCTTLQLPPEPPTLSLVQATANSLKLKWTTVGAPQNDTPEFLYFYLEKENENGKFLPVYEGENRSARIKSLRESTSHRFRIRASRVRSAPQLAGRWSEVVTFQTTRHPPPGIRSAPTVAEIEPGLLQIEWQAYKPAKETGADENSAKHIYYKVQTAPKTNRDKGSESWKNVYQGPVTACTYTISTATAASTLPISKQFRVIVVQKYESDEEEVQSVPSPVAIFNSQRSPTDSPRKRSIKPTSGQSTPSSMVSGRSASANATGRLGAATHGAVRTAGGLPAHKMSLWKRLKRFLTKRSISERDGAFLVLTFFVLAAIGIAVLLNNYYDM